MPPNVKYEIYEKSEKLKIFKLKLKDLAKNSTHRHSQAQQSFKVMLKEDLSGIIVPLDF